MPAAGQIIRALDFTAAQYAADPGNIPDVIETTPQIGNPEVSVTVVAPTSGRLGIIVGGGGVDSAGNRVLLEPLVRAGSSAGADVSATDVQVSGWGSSPGATAAMYGGGIPHIVSGLTPGAVYWCAVTYRVTGGSTADVAARSIFVLPLAA